jgi:hypothetical protein
MKQGDVPAQPDRQTEKAHAKKKVYAPPAIVSRELMEVVAGICGKTTFGDGVCGISSPLAS